MALRVLLACSLIGLLIGCGESGPTEFPVKGEVTFNGTPVETGRITMKREGDGKGFSTEIINGAYQMNAEPGKMSVEIIASRLIPGKFDNSNGTPEPVGQMYIPAKYNRATTLTAEVKAQKENALPFALVPATKK